MDERLLLYSHNTFFHPEWDAIAITEYFRHGNLDIYWMLSRNMSESHVITTGGLGA